MADAGTSGISPPADYGFVTPSGFTFECWFRRSALPPAGGVVLASQRTQASVIWPGYAKHVVGRQWGVALASSGSLYLQVINKGTSSTAGAETLVWSDPSPGTYASDNAWHHLVVYLYYDKVTWVVILDGEVLYQGVASAVANWEPGTITIGADYAPHLGDWGSSIYEMELAHVALYGYPIGLVNAQTHHAAGSGGSVYYGDDEVTRLTRILDWADVPQQARELEAPLQSLQGIAVQEQNALDKAQETVEAVGGVLYADGQTRIVYHNRRHRYNRRSIMTLSEGTQSAPETHIVFAVDDERVYNDIKASRPNSSRLRLRDPVSEAAFGRNFYSFSIPVTSHEVLRNATTWFLSRYGRDVVRVSAVTFAAESSAKIEKLARGGVRIGDVITLDELPERAPAPSMSFVVEAIDISADYKERKWHLTLSLSPYEINKVFQVGVSNLGGGYAIAY